MIRLISIFIVVFIYTILFAQAPDTMWTKTFGDSLIDVGYSVQETNDGGYIITGYSGALNVNRRYDVFLIKTDSNGDTLWTKTFGDSLKERGYSVQQTNDGGYIVVGDKAHNYGRRTDIWLIKTNANGDTVWTKTIKGVGEDIYSGRSIQQTIDGGYIIAGTFSDIGWGHGSDEPETLLIKTDSNGDILWTKTYGRGYRHIGKSVQQTIDGGYIIAGKKLIKTDMNGDTLWTKSFEGGEYRSVQQTTDGGYIFVGSFFRGIFSHDEYVGLVKTDAYGDTLWTKTFGVSPDCLGRGYSVQQTTDGGYIISGSKYSEYDVWLIKTDVNGDTLWNSTINRGGYEDIGYSVQQTRDEGYILAGLSGQDVLLIKVAPEVTPIDKNPHVSVNDYQLSQNYPNPFNPETKIQFSIPKAEFVTLKIYNLMGQEVATLVSEKLNAGKYEYKWDAGDLASGVYMYRIQAGNYVRTKKMILLR